MSEAEFELKQAPVLVKSFGGCGVQLNHHVYAKQTMKLGVPEPAFADLEQKVVALAPQFIRIFYSDKHDGVPFKPTLPPSRVNVRQSSDQADRWKSFVRVVGLAQKTGATINITWQGGPLVTPAQRATSAARFANVLEMLVKGTDPLLEGGIDNLRWVTIANEPNTPPKRKRPQAGAPQPPTHAKTPVQLGTTYRVLDKLLIAKGIRKQLRFMGGDLIEGSRDPKSPYNQAKWFEHMSKHQLDILDSFSTHIYWDYDELARFRTRLEDVRNILNRVAKVPPGETLRYPVPVFITEFGTRSKDRRVKGVVTPGNYHEGDTKIPLAQTNIAAFQAALFQIRALQMGYAGMAKWDCHFGKYDSGTQAHYMIGPPGPPAQPRQWQLYPTYFLLRLITMTTAPGWRVLPVKRNTSTPGSGTKHLVAFQGGGTDLTILGLDERGAASNKASGTQVSYTIGGLPPNTSFKLVLWNKAGTKVGGRTLSLERTIATDGTRVAKVTNVPAHSVFALTTRTLPAL